MTFPAPCCLDHDGETPNNHVKKPPEEQPEQSHYYVGFKDAFAGHLKPERTEPSLLFRNVGENRFIDVTEEVGIKADGWSGDAMR